MRIKEVVRLSLIAMIKNKMRTTLTVLGMVIGIASIIIVFSAGEGIRSLIIGQIEAFGTNIIQTEVRVPSSKKGMEAETDSAGAIASGVQVTTMKEKDLEDIKKIDNVSSGYGAILSQETLTYLSETKKVFLFGVGPDYINIDKSEVSSGYFFTDSDNNSLSQVIVLGSKIAQDIFQEDDPVGKTVTIKRGRYQVIGVLEERGATVGLDFDSMVFLPVKTLQKKIMGIDYFMYMVHKIIDPNQSEETAEIMREILRENHDIPNPDRDDFRVTTMGEMLKTSKNITNSITILLLLIVTISLIVGGVGILNVMYVIVSERTPEIGLRKAVGAKFSDIMRQFLIESILITLIGAFFGIILGILFSFLICLGANYFGLEWKFVLPFKAFVVSILFALFFGVLFGLLPARKAGRLDPVEALRKD
ncbi:MAG: ABC transporter permease [Patescibacteria group bacterium]|nr:ABC transporter permease [Patescibacteria group bacterium]